MSVFVVDASVVIKWFVPEIHTDAAKRLLETTAQYVAPDLLFPEVGNAIWQKVRRAELSPRQGRELAGNISKIAVEAVPARGLFEDAFSVAIATGLTVYDAMYVALAVRLETTLITADDGLVRSVASHRMLARHVGAVHEIPKG